MLWLLDRRGGRHELDHRPEEPAAQALLRHGIPPTSVLVYRDDEEVVPDDAPLASTTVHIARLIEGYDIMGIRQLYGPELSGSGPDSPVVSGLLRRRLSIASTGALRVERHHLGADAVARYVEQTVADTIDRFALLSSGSSVVLGLSGGVDSGSLLMLLSAYRDQLVGEPPTIHAATFQDFDSQYSETFEFAARLADRFDVKHHVLEPQTAEDTFHLTRPVAQILMLLMETDDAHFAMYVDHHTTRRVLEVFADEHSISNIALGLHTTDLLAGMINSWSTGHDVGTVPERAVGPYRYVLPLAFVPKRELHLYYSSRTGHLPTQSTPNQWEFNPSDRNYFYYLADQLQWLWPGIQHFMFSAHTAVSQSEATFHTCENCGAAARQTDIAPEWTGLCDVCRLLDRHGWVRG
ncbi:MAG: hypothetical protein GEU83_19740 [Pseudonocardiaceae bacterium]|nr:hypothetical protein [Pseudonocardiaceae bacterium]